MNPIQARYQTSPHPDISLHASAPKYITTSDSENQVLFFRILKILLTHSAKMFKSECRDSVHCGSGPSSRDRTSVHRTSAFSFSNLSTERKNKKEQMRFRQLGFECRDSVHYGAGPVKPGPGKCPLDTCIEFFESRHKRKKLKEQMHFQLLRVRVSRFVTLWSRCGQARIEQMSTGHLHSVFRISPQK